MFEVDGPGKEGGVPLDVRARAIFAYFKKYNYEVRRVVLRVVTASGRGRHSPVQSPITEQQAVILLNHPFASVLHPLKQSLKPI